MNARIRRLAVGLLIAYIALFVQLNVLQVSQSASLNADVRNSRQTVREFNKTRGAITTSDGQVIADSIPSTDTKFDFQRRYPFGPLFADVTGYWSYGFGATQVEKTQNEVLSGRSDAQNVNALPNIFDRAISCSATTS